MRTEIKGRDNKDEVSLFKAKELAVVIIGKECGTFLNGTVIYTEHESFPLGMHDEHWDKSLFDYFYGEVILSN